MDEDTKPVEEMSENTGDTSSKGLSRRDALKAGAVTAGAMAFYGAMGPGVAGAATAPWVQTDYQNFARLVKAAWSTPSLRTQYAANPTQVLAQFGITLPAGTPPPTIPAKPATSLGYSTTGSKAFRTKVHSSFESWDLQVTNVGTAIAISSLACIACPVSSFSSLSNG